MREKILTIMEKNSRIDLAELAVILGEDEAAVVNELEEMEEEHIICGYHTLLSWERARSRWPMRSPIWRRKISSAATIR